MKKNPEIGLSSCAWLLLVAICALFGRFASAQPQPAPAPPAAVKVEEAPSQPIEITPPGTGLPITSEPTPETPAGVLRIYNLQSAVRRALEAFPGLDVYRKATEIAARQLQEAKHTTILPSIELKSFFGPVPDVANNSGPPDFPNVGQNISADDGIFFRLEIEAVQPIFTFGRLSILKKLARTGLKAAEQEEIEKLHELIFNVKQIYFGLAALNTVEGFLNEIELKLGFVEKRIDALLARGKSDVTESDRLKVQVFRSDLQNRQYETGDNQNKLRHALALVMGYGDKLEGWAIDKQNITKIQSEPFNIEAVLQWARKTNPQLKRLTYLVDAKRYLMNMAQAEMLPVLFLGGAFEYAVAPDRLDVDNPFLVDEFNELTGGVALGLRQDLSIHLLRDRYLKSKLEFEQAQFQQRLAEDAILADVRSKVVSADYSSKKLEVTTDGLRAARSWVGAELNNYEFGLTPTKDVLEAFIAYAKTKLDFIDSTVKYNLAISGLTRVAYRELFPIYYKGDGRQ